MFDKEFINAHNEIHIFKAIKDIILSKKKVKHSFVLRPDFIAREIN